MRSVDFLYLLLCCIQIAMKAVCRVFRLMPMSRLQMMSIPDLKLMVNSPLNARLICWHVMIPASLLRATPASLYKKIYQAMAVAMSSASLLGLIEFEAPTQLQPGQL